MHLVAPSAMFAIAEVAEIGAGIYGERNWEKGLPYSKVYPSLVRHLMAWWSGEDFDPESGKPHTYHILWNAHALVELERRVNNGTLPAALDDRPTF